MCDPTRDYRLEAEPGVEAMRVARGRKHIHQHVVGTDLVSVGRGCREERLAHPSALKARPHLQVVDVHDRENDEWAHWCEHCQGHANNLVLDDGDVHRGPLVASRERKGIENAVHGRCRRVLRRPPDMAPKLPPKLNQSIGVLRSGCADGHGRSTHQAQPLGFVGSPVAP